MYVQDYCFAIERCTIMYGGHKTGYQSVDGGDGSLLILYEYACWLAVFVEGHQCKDPVHYFFPSIFMQMFQENVHFDLDTGIAHFMDAANQFNHSAGRDGFLEIDLPAAHQYKGLPAEPGGGHEGSLCHHHDHPAAEHGIVVIEGIRENNFKNMGLRLGNPFFSCHWGSSYLLAYVSGKQPLLPADEINYMG